MISGSDNDSCADDSLVSDDDVGWGETGEEMRRNPESGLDSVNCYQRRLQGQEAAKMERSKKKRAARDKQRKRSFRHVPTIPKRSQSNLIFSKLNSE